MNALFRGNNNNSIPSIPDSLQQAKISLQTVKDKLTLIKNMTVTEQNQDNLPTPARAGGGKKRKITINRPVKKRNNTRKYTRNKKR